jgi:peptide/nickel transport system substrate-binding protein
MTTPLLNRLLANAKGAGLDRREVLRLASMLGLGVGGMAACAPTTGRRRTLRISAQLTDMRDIHSNTGVYSSNVVNPTLDYLCTVDPSGATRGALAERWTASEDLRTWTFHLRKTARWRKGGPVTADQVLWNWRRWVDPKVGSAYLGCVTAYMMKRQVNKPSADRDAPHETWVPWDASLFEKLDDHTIQVNLKQPAVTVAEDLFTASSLITDPEEGGQFVTGCNGTGPFELLEYRVNDQAIYRALDSSWRGRPQVDRLEFVDPGNDPAVIAAALVSNEIQGVVELSPQNALLFQHSPDIRVYAAQSAATRLIRAHCDIEPFHDARVRRAMRLAVDPAQVVQLALGGWGTAGQHTHVSPTQPDHGQVIAMQQDLPEARRLLAQAGYAKGFKTTLSTNSSDPPSLKSAQVVAQMWSKIGIDAAIQSLPNELFFTHWQEFPLSVTGWAHRPLAIMTLALSYRSGALWNESHYSNPAIDALIDQAQLVLDPVKRSVQIGQIQRLLQEDGPLVQPIWMPTTSAFHRSVTGVKPHPMAYYPCEHISYA